MNETFPSSGPLLWSDLSNGNDIDTVCMCLRVMSMTYEERLVKQADPLSSSS